MRSRRLQGSGTTRAPLPLHPEKGIARSGIGMSHLMLERFEEDEAA